MILSAFLGLLFTLGSPWAKPDQDTTLPGSQYQLLSAAHAAYQELAARDTWSFFPQDICLRPGDTDQHILKLRNNLLLTGDLPAVGAAPVFLFDDSLALALKNFQRRHGLIADGIAGARTLAALNVPPQERVRQIALNLVRWQQLPADAYPLVLVNIPDYTLQLIDQAGKTVWQTNVIVGQRSQPFHTARIQSKISYLVLNPTWHIPPSILRNEIFPILKKDPAYLSRNRMHLYRVRGSRKTRISPYAINWNQADTTYKGLVVIQQAGPKNALGKIKFIFTNPAEQYLHDTPVKSLFSHPVRAYSHGCVRVQDPEILAAYLLSPDWNRPLQPGQVPHSRLADKHLYLPKPVTIVIGYFTAWVNEKGDLQFRPDIYQLDKIEGKANLL